GARGELRRLVPVLAVRGRPPGRREGAASAELAHLDAARRYAAPARSRHGGGAASPVAPHACVGSPRRPPPPAPSPPPPPPRPASRPGRVVPRARAGRRMAPVRVARAGRARGRDRVPRVRLVRGGTPPRVGRRHAALSPESRGGRRRRDARGVTVRTALAVV